MLVKTNGPVRAMSEAIGLGALDTDQDQAENSRDFVLGRRINVKSSVDKGSQIESGQSDFEREEGMSRGSRVSVLISSPF